VPIQYQLSAAIVPQETVVSKYWVKAKKDSNFEKDNMSVFFPAGTFYDDFNLNFDVQNDTLLLDKDTTPAHSNFTITIEDKKYTEAQREKLYIATINGLKRGYNYTSRKDGVFTIKVKTLGKYALVLDETPPKITIAKPIEGKWLNGQKSIQVSISDDLSGIKSYNGYLNGKWILFEYDNKTRKITHNFSDGIVTEGANELKIIVIDNLGNSTIFETRFFRSQKP
jgi:hypothetical protein